MIWIKAEKLGISGRAHIYEGYKRFPENIYPKLKENKMDNVFGLSQNGAGLHVDFRTNSENIAVKYELSELGLMPHMALTGSSGIDTYIKYRDKWLYYDTVFPPVTENIKTAEKTVFDKNYASVLKDSEYMTFSLNFPLYNTITSMEIGIDENAEIEPIIYTDKSPVVVYGSSITQGGCASRPGMAYTNILRRNIDRDLYNLGFSGSGLLEHCITDILTSYNAEILIMDCVANMAENFGRNDFRERFQYFYSVYRKAHPNTPVIFMEQPVFTKLWAVLGCEHPCNIWLREMFDEWNKKDRNIYIIHSDVLYGDDKEAAVDGIHATDLGFYRMSIPVIKTVRSLLKFP